MDRREELEKAVSQGDELKADEATRLALEEGADPLGLMEHGAVEGIHEAGRLWQAGEYFLPDIVLAIEAYNVVMKRLEPLIASGPGRARGKVVIGSVEGDAHDLGKNIVVALLRCASYEVVDLGVDVPAERFVEAARRDGADIIGLGAYMTTTMRNMEGVIARLEEAGVRGGIKVIVGGAAVTGDYAERIGADGYAGNAAEAVELVDGLMGVK